MVEAERVLIAAKDGDLQTLRSLRRSAPFAADGFGATTLHYAARTGRMDCVKWLVETVGISPNVRGKSGATPLHDAAAQGQLECVKYFLRNSAVDVETRDLSGHTALHLAARFGRFETVKWLIERGNSDTRAKSKNRMTPVHFASSGGHLTCLELLVFKAGYSSVNDVATDGTTPLYLATQDGNLDCLKYLNSVGGKCDARARDGMLPIHGAAQNGHLDCVGYLIEKGQADVDERDTTGATPAHYAAAQGHVNVLKWLNAKGDISSTDNLGGSPLHDAAEQGQFEVCRYGKCIRYLVETAELGVSQTDKEGLTPLALAEKSGHRRCIDYLKIATSKQAKALKRQLKTKKQKAEEDSKKATTEKVPCIPAKSGVASDPPKNSLFIQRASSDRTDNQTAANRSNNRKKDEEVKVQVKTGFPSFSFAKESCVKSREAPTQTSTLPATANSHFDNTNNNALGSNYNNTDNDKCNSIGNSVNNDNKNSKDSNTNNDDNNSKKSSKKIELIESNELENVASSSQITAESSLHNTRPAETIAPASTKPLRERQLQPLPHFGNVIPPPLEFSENTDASNDKGEKVTKQVSFQQTDSLSVIVEIQSLENKGDRWRIHEKSQGAKVIDPKTRSSQSVKEQPCSNGHVTDTGSSVRRADHSVCEELGSDLPPWKRQILLNRKLKERAREKAEREKKEIEERKWIGVASWKIPLLAKRETERLKEEKRWVGMPEWKKHLLSRRGTERIYREYHAINRCLRSAEPLDMPQSPDYDDITRPREITSPN